jgi:hypothetical protein
MTNVFDPCLGSSSKNWKLDLQVHLVDKISVSGDGCGNFSSKVHGSIKRLFDGFNSKVSVSSIDDFKNVYTPPFGVFKLL